jgi:hypothetical protein
MTLLTRLTGRWPQHYYSTRSINDAIRFSPEHLAPGFHSRLGFVRNRSIFRIPIWPHVDIRCPWGNMRHEIANYAIGVLRESNRRDARYRHRFQHIDKPISASTSNQVKFKGGMMSTHTLYHHDHLFRHHSPLSIHLESGRS